MTTRDWGQNQKKKNKKSRFLGSYNRLGMRRASAWQEDNDLCKEVSTRVSVKWLLANNDLAQLTFSSSSEAMYFGEVSFATNDRLQQGLGHQHWVGCSGDWRTWTRTGSLYGHDEIDFHWITKMVAKDDGVMWKEVENDWQNECMTVSWEHVKHMYPLIWKGDELKREGFNSQWEGVCSKARGCTASFFLDQVSQNGDMKRKLWCWLDDPFCNSWLKEEVLWKNEHSPH